MNTYKFKNDITLDNSKSFRWTTSTAGVYLSALTLNTLGNLCIVGGSGDTQVTSSSFLVNSKIGVGVNTSITDGSTIALGGTANYISSYNNAGFLCLSGTFTGKTTGSKMYLCSTGVSNGSAVVSASSVIFNYGTSGAISNFTSDTFTVLPNGSNVALGVSSTSCSLGVPLRVTDSTISLSPTTGSVVIQGGVGIVGDIHIGGTTVLGYTSVAASTINTLLVSSTSQSVGLGTGGSFTCLGGASITKDVYIGGAITNLSDGRYKTDITELALVKPNLLESVAKLRAVTYRNRFTDNTEIGLVAQELKQVFPELVKGSDDTVYSVDYSRLSVLLLECVQELLRRTSSC